MIALERQLDIHSLHKQGFSNSEIARRVGVDRRTVKRHLDNADKINQPRTTPTRGSLVDPYRDQIAAFLQEDPDYRATALCQRLKRSGYQGGYELVKRVVHTLKAEKTRLAYVRFESEPAQQAQVDFAEFMLTKEDGTTQKYYLFAMILGYSRKLYAELLTRCDMVAFLEAHIRAFAFFGGVPAEVLYDRMRNVFVREQVCDHKQIFTQSVVQLALHYGFAPRVTPAYAPWVKGKIERPMDFVREGWWRGYRFHDLATANADLLAWLTEKEQRIHGTTNERIDVRFAREKTHLLALPPHPCDISERLSREVRKDCTIAVLGNSYVVEHTLVGKQVLVRVRHNQLRVFDGNRLVVTYTIPEGRGQLVQDPRFYAALRADQALQERKFARSQSAKGGFARKGRAIPATISPAKPTHPVDVQTFEAEQAIQRIEAQEIPPLVVQQRSLSEYAALGGEVCHAG